MVPKFWALLKVAIPVALGLVAVGCLAYLSPLALTSLNRSLILYPDPAGPEYQNASVNGIQREDVYFQNPEGDKLHGWFFQLPNPKSPVILYSHGNGGNIGRRLILVKGLLEAGASVFLFDYRAYGKSEGTADLNGIVTDTKAAYDYLTITRKIAPSKIVLYGESIGGGPTCALAKEVPAGGIILDSTFTSLMQVARKKVWFFNIYPDFLGPVPPLDNISVIRGRHAPLLIIHGALDEVIPYSEAEENFQAASSPKWFLMLPHSKHNDKRIDAPMYVEGVRKFLISSRV